MSGISSRRLLLICNRQAIAIGASAALFILHSATLAAPITTGNLVLVRVAGGAGGDGSAALLGGGGANKVFLDEYTTGGTLVQSFAMPSTLSTTVGSQRALTLSGTQNQEGHLTLSGNGQYFIMAGYNQTELVVGTNASVATTTERVIGRMDFNGNIDTTTALVDAMSQQSVRSAYSTNGTDIWVTGNGGNAVTVNSVTGITTTGVHYAQFGVNTGGNTLSNQLNTIGLSSNNRYLLVAGGTLYVGNGTNPNAVGPPPRGIINTFTSGGTPTAQGTASGPQLQSLPGFTPAGDTTADDFWFYNANTIYLADQRTNGINGGIQKWTFDGSTWSLQYTLGTTQLFTTAAVPAAAGVHGLTGRIGPSNEAVLFGTTFDGTGANATRFFTVTDTGAASIVTILGTSSTNSAFRGIEIAQLPPDVPEPASMVLLVLGVLGAAAGSRRRKQS